MCAFDYGAFDSVAFDVCVPILPGGTPNRYPFVRWEPSDTIFEEDEEWDERLRNLELARRVLAERRVLDKLEADRLTAERLENLARGRETQRFNREFRYELGEAMDTAGKRESRVVSYPTPPPPPVEAMITPEDRRQTEIKEERMRNLAKAQEANRLKKEREAEIYAARLKNLKKARKAKQ